MADVVAVEDLLEGLEWRVVAERLGVDLLGDVVGAVDEPEVAGVEVLEQASAQKSFSSGL